MTVAELEAPTTRRYPMYVITFARRLHEQNGWSAHRIRKALIGRGYSPSYDTVLSWIDEDYAEMRRDSKRVKGQRTPRRLHGWDRRLARMSELRGIGLSYRAIAALMSHDFDLEITSSQAEYLLTEAPKTRTVKRLLWPGRKVRR